MNKIIKEIPGYEPHDEATSPGWKYSKTGWCSDAARCGPFIFSGAIGCRPFTHELGETMEEQVRLIF